MLRLKSLRIDKLRKVQPGTILNFTGDKNLVLGKNGVGKTTLLEVIACAAKLDFFAFRAEELDVAVELQESEPIAPHAAASIEAHFIHKNGRAPSPLDALRHGGPTLAVSINLRIRVGGACFDANFEHGKITAFESDIEILNLNEDIDFAVAVQSLNQIVNFLIAQKRTGLTQELQRTVRALYDRMFSERLDESLDVIRKQMVKPIRLRIGTLEFDGGASIQLAKDHQTALVKSATVDSEQLKGTSADVAFLRAFGTLVDAELVKSIFYRQSRGDYGDAQLLTFHNQNFFVVRGQSEIDFEKFSYGQKRLLAILQYLASNEEVVVADEITNGLHHEWIDFIVKKLEGRQCFLTSQNPVLLDFLTFTSAAETQNRLIRCEHGANGTLIWRNLTEQEANDFYTSYETGMQHVGEIMLKQGLW